MIDYRESVEGRVSGRTIYLAPIVEFATNDASVDPQESLSVCSPAQVAQDFED